MRMDGEMALAYSRERQSLKVEIWLEVRINLG